MVLFSEVLKDRPLETLFLCYVLCFIYQFIAKCSEAIRFYISIEYVDYVNVSWNNETFSRHFKWHKCLKQSDSLKTIFIRMAKIHQIILITFHRDRNVRPSKPELRLTWRLGTLKYPKSVIYSHVLIPRLNLVISRSTNPMSRILAPWLIFMLTRVNSSSTSSMTAPNGQVPNGCSSVQCLGAIKSNKNFTLNIKW